MTTTKSSYFLFSTAGNTAHKASAKSGHHHAFSRKLLCNVRKAISDKTCINSRYHSSHLSNVCPS